MPDHIKAHSRTVEKIAVFLAEKLKRAGEDVNVELTSRAALLHDIGKTAEIKKTCGGAWHGEIGYDILVKEGFPELAEAARKHILTYLLDHGVEGLTWEEKIVRYADARVNDNKIVSLEERYVYLLDRYGSLSAQAHDALEKTRPLSYALEKQIFDKIRIKPNQIAEL